MESTRIDKWLWAARFYKTRSVATDAIQRGWVQIGEQDVKPSREVHVGDVLKVIQAKVPRTVVVKGISATRGSAPVAQQLYEETADSVTKRQKIAEQNRLSPDPALSLTQGRPTKRDRRSMEKDWGDRWSASID